MQLVLGSTGDYATFTTPGGGNGSAQTAATYTTGINRLTKTGAFASIPGNSAKQIALTGATWTNGTLTLTKVGAFATYVFYAASATTGYPGDKVLITSGTGATVGLYTVASRTSDDAIVLTATIGAGADGQTNIAGNVCVPDYRYRVNITAGTGATVGHYFVAAKISDNEVVLDRQVAAGSPSDVAFTLLDNELMRGFYCVALADYTSGQTNCRVMLRGVTKAFTKNSAGGGGAAIAVNNLFAPTTAKDLESRTLSYGNGAKLIAKAIEVGTAGATNTRALRNVIFNGIEGFGGNYTGVA